MTYFIKYVMSNNYFCKMINKRIAFHTLGCKLNFAETSTVSRTFYNNKYTIVNFSDLADIYVINTCLVTAIAEKKCLSVIRQAHKRNPEAKIAVIGCLPQLKPQKLASIEGVRFILNNNEKYDLINYLDELSVTSFQPPASNFQHIFMPSYSLGDRTRSFLKIQDGCDYYCSYCIIPAARGRSRSSPIEKVIECAGELAAKGIKEIVLTGVNIGDFGKKNNENFLQLIKELDKINGIDRYRISSIEPDLLNEDIIEFVAKSDKFLPHFHIPLQSGSDKVLKLMHRKYKRALFVKRINYIKSLIPDCLIAVDVIVGFPGESDEDFEDTMNFIKISDITYVHVFTFSERENTLAFKMDNKVPVNIRRQRSKKLQLLSDNKKILFYLQNKGKTRDVLFESDNDNGFMYGFTDNYIKVKTPFNENLINKIVPVKLETLDKDNVFITL
jgi:threonylcarbamoyladenosine tRNA methylthiotransferase MtaB